MPKSDATTEITLIWMFCTPTSIDGFPPDIGICRE